MNAIELPANSGRNVEALTTRLGLLARRRLEEHPHFRHRSATVIIESCGDTLVLTGRLPSCYLKQILSSQLAALPGVAKIDNQVDVVCCDGLSRVDGSPTGPSGHVEVDTSADNIRGQVWRSSWPLLRVFVLAICSFVVLNWSPRHASADTWASKMFETTSHEFGALARGSKAEFEFVFTNIYLDDVNVASVRSSCSCAAVRVKEPLLKTYQKGAIIASIGGGPGFLDSG